MRLFLLRHGESVTNVQRVFATRKLDPLLSEAGLQQAELQAEALAKVGLAAIYASTLRRARQTAEIVGRQCGLSVRHTDLLREVHVGIVDGLSIEDPVNRRVYDDTVMGWGQDRLEVGFPDGETLGDVERRFRAFLNGLGAAEDPILVVGHGVLFMAIVWLFCDDRHPQIEDNYMGRGHVSILRGQGDRFRLEAFNVSPEDALRGALLPTE
ncbi:MAG: histidine phosphatase family protein [Anaerolineales bacterium]|nr:histidine phosphatase family protein [Anaerolineales bacterium]